MLGKIFMALLQDRLSLRKAGTLGFLGQMLLRSQREVAFHKKIEQEAAKKLEAENMYNRVVDIPQAAPSRVYPGDIERKEKELARLKQQAAEEAAEDAAKKTAENVECGSSAPALPRGGVTATEKTAEAPKANSGAKGSAVGAPGNIGVARKKDAVALPIEQHVAERVVPARPPDLNHFFPRDPQMIAAGLQAPRNSAAPPGEDAEERRWREVSRRFAPSRRNH